MTLRREPSVLDSVGNTPLVRLPQTVIWKDCPAPPNIWLKMELYNPSGSIKDRIAKHICDRAEASGELKPGRSVIVEVTSGNTGIAFSMAAAARGYPIKILMPEHMSRERVMIMEALGAEVILTPESEGFLGALETSRRMAAADDRVFLPRQFENPHNTEAHFLFTAQEIFSQTRYALDAFVAGIGTGGTLMGVAQAVRLAGLRAKIVAVEPAESAVLSGERPGCHKIQGLGDGFQPNLVEMSGVDDVVKVKSDDAIEMARRLTRALGSLVGISSGANVLGAIACAERLGEDQTIVTIVADAGSRYFSTDLFAGHKERAAGNPKRT